MMSASTPESEIEARAAGGGEAGVSRATKAAPVKFARILDEEEGEFSLEYDDTRGQKNVMRLDALTYEDALLETRSFLGIREGDRDEDGDLWAVE